jgi:glutamine synthetase adenylyltransferase
MKEKEQKAKLQKKPMIENDVDKMSTYSRKSVNERRVENFLQNMHTIETSNLEEILADVCKIHLKMGYKISKEEKNTLEKALQFSNSNLLEFLAKFSHLNHHNHPEHPLNKNSLTTPEEHPFFKKYGKIYPEELRNQFEDLKATKEISRIDSPENLKANFKSEIKFRRFFGLLNYLKTDLYLISKD